MAEAHGLPIPGERPRETLAPGVSLAGPLARTFVRVQLARRARAGADAALARAGLPLEPGTFVAGPPLAWWTAPNGWLVEAGASEAAAVVARVSTALDGLTHAAVDVSDSLAAFELDGPGVPALLARGCALDLAARADRAWCTRTRLVSVPVLLRAAPRAPVTLVVDASLARWTEAWLRDAAAGLASPARAV